MRRAVAAFLDQYSAESSATKISAKRASTRGLPDSRTTASANSLREAIICSRRSRNFAHRSRIGTFAQSRWATRARETISGSKDAGVLPNCASTSPVAGLIEGSESMGMAVAAISAILTDFEAGVWPRILAGLPQTANRESVKHLIIADNRNFLDLCLSDQQTVEWIFVSRVKTACEQSVLH